MVRLTDRPDITLVVTVDVKQQQQLLLNKMIDSLFMYLSAARDYRYPSLTDRICIFTKNGFVLQVYFFSSETVIL